MNNKSHTHCQDEKCCHTDVMNNLESVLKKWRITDDDSRRNVAVKTDLIPGPKIEKKILHSSKAPIPSGCESPGGGLAYPKESKFIFHYLIRKVDDDHKVLDDTRLYGKTMELYSGKEFQLDFWEYCLETMLPGEVACFTVPPERLLAFPAVNKKLRDYMLDKKASEVKHCCGLMGFQEQGGLGYSDLDELMVKPEPLEFIFDLVRVDIPGSVRKDTWIMTTEEKTQLVPVLRDEGNSLYKLGDYETAASKYREALGLLEQLLLREKPGDPEWVQLNKSRVPFLTNLAQCQLKLKQFYDVISSTSDALSCDPANVKALYRRSKAYTETWQFDLAESDLRRVSDLKPEMAQVVNSDLKALNVMLKEHELTAQRLLAGKLSWRSSAPTVVPSEPS